MSICLHGQWAEEAHGVQGRGSPVRVRVDDGVVGLPGSMSPESGQRCAGRRIPCVLWSVTNGVTGVTARVSAPLSNWWPVAHQAP